MKPEDHTQWVGAIVTNLQALETCLRYFLLPKWTRASVSKAWRSGRQEDLSDALPVPRQNYQELQ
ncbi:hypothetical protein, partial [Bradyrhizobium uaiense]|uniref:hypothetical protein n=1 Tax=Bradyrhizobium uaiense TaxID=2594946 RepID=UPI0019D4FCFA